LRERIREFEEENSWRVYGDDEFRGRSERSLVCCVLPSYLGGLDWLILDWLMVFGSKQPITGPVLYRFM